MSKALIFLLNITIIATIIVAGDNDYDWDRHNYGAPNLNNLGEYIQRSVYDGLKPLRSPEFHNLNNLGANINKQVRQSLAPLDNLGANIEQSVWQGLEPVRALELQMKMRGGIGGTTIINYQPNGKSFIVRNNRQYQCTGGTISPQTGDCLAGSLDEFKTHKDTDYCYVNNVAHINNHVCLSAQQMSVSVINNIVSCTTNDNGSSVLFTTNEKYRETCLSLANTANYKYIASKSDPNRVEIPNRNRYVKCLNNNDNEMILGICEFTDNNRISSFSNNNRYYASGSYYQFNNGNNVYYNSY